MAGGNENKAKAGAVGAIEAVVAALRAHPGSATVLERCCSALNKLCWKSADVQRRAREAGAVEALQAALRAFPEGPVSEEAKQALEWISLKRARKA